MKQHYVELNQTIDTVAALYSISSPDLIALNPILNERQIETGMTLMVPGEYPNVFERAFVNAYEHMAASIHNDNVKKGFWPLGGRSNGLDKAVEGERNVGEMIALVHSELSEALEAHRKNLTDNKLPQYHGTTVEFADAIIRLMDLGYGMGLPVAQAIIDKLAYNRTRPFKHGVAY